MIIGCYVHPVIPRPYLNLRNVLDIYVACQVGAYAHSWLSDSQHLACTYSIFKSNTEICNMDTRPRLLEDSRD